MGKGVLFICLAVLVIFSLPILVGVELPRDLSAKELGSFLAKVLRYWLGLLQEFWKTVTGGL